MKGLLVTHRRNLARLERRAAKHGGAVPIYLARQIEHEKREIVEIEGRMKNER